MKKLFWVCSVALCLLLGSMSMAEGAGVTAVLADASAQGTVLCAEILLT